MKIAFLGTTLYNQGAEFVLATTARALADNGHEVDVVVTAVNDDIAKARPQVKPFDIGNNARQITLKGRRGRECILELRGLMKRGGYDAVVCHASPMTIPMILASIALKKRPKLIHVEHMGGIGVVYETGAIAYPKFSFGAFVRKRIMSCLDAQFVVSKGTLEAINRMTEYPRERIHLVYNPVLDDVFEGKRMQKAEHPWLKEKSTLPVIVAAGAFAGVKHFDMLIEAFAKVRKEVPCKLVIFGEGSFRPRYEKVIKDLGIEELVSLPGFTNQLPAEIRNASLFVVSSKVESFSIVLVEAMACGVPVVSTDAPYGPREILRDGEYGILVKNWDVDALANGIRRALTGGAIKPTLDMVKRFSVASVRDQYEVALNKIVNK